MNTKLKGSIKMAFDGLVLNAVSNELACLIGGKLQKIYEPDENEI